MFKLVGMNVWLRLEPPLTILCLLYLAGLIGLSVVDFTQPFSDAYGWWALPGLWLNVLPVLYLGALPVLIFGILVRHYSLVVGSALNVALAVYLFAPYFVADAHPTNVPADISVMTFNTIVNPVALGSAMGEYGTDLVLIQETPGLSELQELEVAQDYTLIYGGERRGNAVFSKYPVLEERNISLEGGWEAQRLVVEVDGRELAVYNVHLLLPLNLRPVESTVGQLLGARYDERTRNAQIRVLLRELETEKLPYIVAGDFNLSEYSPVYSELAAVMRDSYREVGQGFGFSWHSSLAFLRIDYIWHSSALTAVRSLRGKRFDSDHYPVVSELAWTR